MREDRRGGGVGGGVGGVMEARSIGSSSWLITGTLGGWRPLGVGIVKVGICFSFSLRVAFFFCDFCFHWWLIFFIVVMFYLFRDGFDGCVASCFLLVHPRSGAHVAGGRSIIGSGW